MQRNRATRSNVWNCQLPLSKKQVHLNSKFGILITPEFLNIFITSDEKTFAKSVNWLSATSTAFKHLEDNVVVFHHKKPHGILVSRWNFINNLVGFDIWKLPDFLRDMSKNGCYTLIFLCHAPWERKQILEFNFGVQVKRLQKYFKFSIALIKCSVTPVFIRLLNQIF